MFKLRRKHTDRQVVWLVAIHICKVNTQRAISTEAKLVKRKTYFLGGCRKAQRETREAEYACALNQDCAADFCLAKQISGGWKIIWSWLWEVVGSGRWVSDGGRRFEG